jgi:hypothetical protein
LAGGAWFSYGGVCKRSVREVLHCAGTDSMLTLCVKTHRSENTISLPLRSGRQMWEDVFLSGMQFASMREMTAILNMGEKA